MILFFLQELDEMEQKMTSKIITYDLCKQGRNYDELYAAIKECNGWARVAESVWFVKTNMSCKELRDKLLSKIDYNDRIFVAELTGVAAWHNTICDGNFLVNNL